MWTLTNLNTLKHFKTNVWPEEVVHWVKCLPLKTDNLHLIPHKDRRMNFTELYFDIHMCSTAHQCLHTTTHPIITNTLKMYNYSDIILNISIYIYFNFRTKTCMAWTSRSPVKHNYEFVSSFWSIKSHVFSWVLPTTSTDLVQRRTASWQELSLNLNTFLLSLLRISYY